MQTLTLLILVLSLGNSSWPQREKAYIALAANINAAEPVLRMGAAIGEPEVQARCGTLLDQWSEVMAPTMRAGGYEWVPWIDGIPHGYPKRDAIIADYLYEVDARWQGEVLGPPHWSRYRQATVYFLKDRLRAGVPVSELQALLELMADYEKHWIWKHRESFGFTPGQLKAAKSDQ